MMAQIKHHRLIAMILALGLTASGSISYWMFANNATFSYRDVALDPYWTSAATGLAGVALTLIVAFGLLLQSIRTKRITDRANAQSAEFLSAKENFEREYAERIQVEAALEDERNMLRTLIDILPNRIFVKNAESKFILANTAQARVFGLGDPEEIYGKSTFDLVPDEGSERRLADDRQVMESGESLINREEYAETSDGNRRWSLTTKVPLKNKKGEIVGVVGTSTDITERKLAAEAVEKYAEELQKRNAQMEADLQMAREIQQAFIPEQAPIVSQSPSTAELSLRFCHRYLPTTTLAGDFYDVLPISDAKVGVIICDVMGHGIRASLFTAYLRGLIEQLTALADDPGALLTELNRGLMAILNRTGLPMFVSAFYMVVDVTRERVQFANAGHPAPFRLKRDARTVETLREESETIGPALGLVENFLYKTQETEIAQNETIMLYTDGLFEVPSSDWEQFGEERLLDALRERIMQSSERLFDELLAEIQEFSGPDGLPDDVCLLAVEYCGPQKEVVPVGKSAQTAPSA